MSTTRLTVVIALLTSVTFGVGATSALASAKGNVTAARAGTGPFSLKFNAGGTTTKAHGQFTYREPQGYTVSGKVTCYYQEGNMAVFTGPVTKEQNPDNNTEAFVVWVTDGGGGQGNGDNFDVAGGGLVGSECATNFGLHAGDYIVTSGDIVVR